MAAEYIKHLYDSDLSGYIQVAQLEDGQVIKIFNTEQKGIRKIVYEQRGEKDMFISPNSFYIPRRSSDNIRHYRALFIDLDLHIHSKTEAAYEVYLLADSGRVPVPTMIVDSGRGIHCYWRIDHAPKAAAYTWQELQDYLYRQLKHLGADIKATDSSRLLRLPDTINSRNNALCKIMIVNDNRYSMYDLREKYLHYKKKDKPEPGKRSSGKSRGKVSRLFNSYTLHMARADDMETICRLRGYKVEGYRNSILHCYCYWKGIYIRDPEQLTEKTHELNSKFRVPLRDSEIRAIVKSTGRAIEKFIDYEAGLRSGEDKRVSKAMKERGGYWYTNDRLIEMLNITEDEQRQLKTIISTKEKRRRDSLKKYQARRNEAGLTQREQQKQDRIKAVKELAEQGLNQTEAAKEIGITKARVNQIINHELKS